MPMNKTIIDKYDFLYRINGATPAQLVVLTYELTEKFLGLALVSGETEKELFAQYVEKAKSGITQLIGGLNFKYELSQVLYDIYLYIIRILTRAYLRYSRGDAEEALALLKMLSEGFVYAVNQETTPAPSAESVQVYAGLTYQKDGLAEYIRQDDGRGYKA